MNNMIRQWKATADAAIAPVHFDVERDRMALELAARLAALGNGNVIASAGLQHHVLAMMDDSWLRASMAARYLDVLGESALTADYEDAGALNAQVKWTQEYLSPVLQDPLAQPLDLSASSRFESISDQLYTALAQHVEHRMQMAAAA